jgi:hypothetical protein
MSRTGQLARTALPDRIELIARTIRGKKDGEVAWRQCGKATRSKGRVPQGCHSHPSELN